MLDDGYWILDAGFWMLDNGIFNFADQRVPGGR